MGEYLFKDGSMIGLNDKLLAQYVEWIANRRMKAIGLKPIYDIPAKNNPLPWTEHWISSKGLQVAPQETEVESYVVGGIKQDVKKIPLLDSNSDSAGTKYIIVLYSPCNPEWQNRQLISDLTMEQVIP